MDEYEGRIEWMNYLNVIWKRKWLIIISTLLCTIVAGVFSFLQPPVWEVDAIIQGGKYFDTERNEEVLIVEGDNLAGQIDEGYYNNLIAVELNLDIKEMPKLKAKNLRWTELVQVSIRAHDVEKASLILRCLFNHLKKEIDAVIDSAFKGNEAQVANYENIIEIENFSIKSLEIEISKLEKEIISIKNKLKKSEENYKNILDQMNAILEKSDEQGYLSSYRALDEKLNVERLTQEQLTFLISDKENEKRILSAEIEEKRIIIELAEIEINLLNGKIGQINHTQFIKEPTSSIYPVAPRKKLNIVIAGVLGLFVFSLFAFFLEYLEKLKKAD